MLKQWWQSRTIWAGLTTIALAVLSLTDVLPVAAREIIDIAQIITGLATIYFRKTTTTDVNRIFADNRFSGTRT